MTSKVPGSWLCPTGYGYRETWNTEQRVNGTSLMRHVPPSEAERLAAQRFDYHVEHCEVCKAPSVTP
jgi:hypothetical protein